METLWQDLKFGVRMLAKNPGFTAVAVLTLALGIGANTTIFSVVNAVLLRPLPYPEPNALVMLWSTWVNQGTPYAGSALPDYREWRDQNRSLEGLGSFFYANYNLSETNQAPERVQGARVTPNLFTVLRAAPALGRSFLPAEEEWGRHRVVLLSYGLWQRRFGGRAEILDQPIILNSDTYTVVGVMPKDWAFFDNTPEVELWTPVSYAPGDNMDSRNNHFVNLVGRLKPGVTSAQAQAEMSAIASRLESQYKENEGLGALVVPLREQLVGDTRQALLVLLGAVGFVLLVACVNVANLLLARAAAREHEFAIRASLGASRGRLVRQSLMESLPLGLAAGGAGLLLGVWGTGLIEPLLPSALPRFNAIAVDVRVLAFTVLVSVVTVVACGLLPSLHAAHANARQALGESGRGTIGGRRRSRVRNLLVTVEMALALVLLAGAGLMVRSFVKLTQVNPGFVPQNFLAMRIPLAAAKYPADPRALQFYEQLLERLRGLPGVESAGVSTDSPLGFGGDWGKFFSVAGRPEPASLSEVPFVRFALVSPDYFRATGIALQRGRAFTAEDTARAQGVAIVNETLARRFFPNEDALGKTIWMGPPETLLPPQEGQPVVRRRVIVGVARDVKDSTLNQQPEPRVYAPFYQHEGEGWSNAMLLGVRTTSAPSALAPSVRELVRSLDADQPITQVATGEEMISRRLSGPRFNLVLLVAFAGLALLLAAVGIYGVISYLVVQRSHELGIRMALGAKPRDIFQLVIGQGVMLALLGVAAGLIASLALTRLMSSLLFDVQATDLPTLAGVSFLLVSVAAVACWIPARRAMRVEPMEALRYE